MMKIVTIIGARPQFVKAASVSRAIWEWNESSGDQKNIKEIIVHTGQHYDENMSRIFFDELQIPRPDYDLGVGSGLHGIQTGKMLGEIEAVLIKENPDCVLTYGDTNSTLAGALAAVKLHIFSAHVEAGLRSYNRRMPEEINRIVADEISNILFCPTDTAVTNLASEGIVEDKTSGIKIVGLNSQQVFQVGDVMYDSILFNGKLAEKKSDILKRLGLAGEAYCLGTLHRPENTDEPEKLKNILEAFRNVASSGTKMILPLHPRTRKYMEKFGLDAAYNLSTAPSACLNSSDGLIFVDPVGYLDMIQLEKYAKAILTDSGGVQKEAYFLNVPCITLRNETEWVETVQMGWNVLTGADTMKITRAFQGLGSWEGKHPPFSYDVPNLDKNISTPYGNGKSAEKIVNILWETFNAAQAGA